MNCSKNKDHFVSVIIPNFNHERYLDERIQSVLSQTYRYFEIIILDDKSTDNSIEVIKKYESNDRVAHIVFNEKNTGTPFLQWQKGFELAKGDIIWIAESDDKCDIRFLEVLVSNMTSSPNCVLSFCKSRRIDENGNVFDDFFIQDKLEGYPVNGRYFIKKYLSSFNYIINASSAIFKKDALNNIDNSYVNYKGCGDWVFWSEIVKNGDVFFCKECLNEYRLHSNNTSMLLKKNGRAMYETQRVISYLYGKGYFSWFLYFRRRLSLLMQIKYTNGLSAETQEELFHSCKYSFVYQLMGRLIHFIAPNRYLSK